MIALDLAGVEGVGVARYVRDPERRESAEIAVAVLERWQGQGVGKELVHRLADRARDEDITEFTALMLSDNRTCGTCSQTWGPPAFSAPKRERSNSSSTCATRERDPGDDLANEPRRNLELKWRGTTLVPPIVSYPSRSFALGDAGDAQGRIDADPFGWGPSGRWFKSSRPDRSDPA